jgi:hypothetical protein
MMNSEIHNCPKIGEINMRTSYQRLIAISLIAATPWIGSGCMMGMMGMGGMHSDGQHGQAHNHNAQSQHTLNQRLDHLIEQAVTDLAANTLPLQTLAIGELRAQAPIDEDILEGKLTAQLVEKGQLAVVDRKRLKLLLDEQGLSLSGAIDASNAPKIGKLVGVDGFLIGAVAINENRLSLNLKIIATESGVVVWAKEMMEGKHQQEGDMMQHMQ